MTRSKSLGILIAALVAPALVARAATKDPEVSIVHLSGRALVPDVAMDAQGVLHVVYGLGDFAWYVRSADNGKTFTRPVKVNAEGKVQLTMGERGPKLAVGKDGIIHVVWADRWAPGVKTFCRYTRSRDGGETFEPLKTIWESRVRQ